MSFQDQNPCLCPGLLSSQFITRIIPGVVPPTPPAPSGCCPCTNLLINGGFDTPGSLAPWSITGTVVQDTTANDVHAGIATGPDTFFAGSATLSPGSSICQSVRVSPGCCYTLNFAAMVPDQLVVFATVQYFSTNPGTCTPPVDQSIVPNIVVPGPNSQAVFESFKLVSSAPAGAAFACICFKVIKTTPGEGPAAHIDSVIFNVTGGSCQ